MSKVNWEQVKNAYKGITWKEINKEIREQDFKQLFLSKKNWFKETLACGDAEAKWRALAGIIDEGFTARPFGEIEDIVEEERDVTFEDFPNQSMIKMDPVASVNWLYNAISVDVKHPSEFPEPCPSMGDWEQYLDLRAGSHADRRTWRKEIWAKTIPNRNQLEQGGRVFDEKKELRHRTEIEKFSQSLIQQAAMQPEKDDDTDY